MGAQPRAAATVFWGDPVVTAQHSAPQRAQTCIPARTKPQQQTPLSRGVLRPTPFEADRTDLFEGRQEGLSHATGGRE